MIYPYRAEFSFVFKARQRAHSRAYVTEAATRKTGEKASEMGRSFLRKPQGVETVQMIRKGQVRPVSGGSFIEQFTGLVA